MSKEEWIDEREVQLDALIEAGCTEDEAERQLEDFNN